MNKKSNKVDRSKSTNPVSNMDDCRSSHTNTITDSTYDTVKKQSNKKSNKNNTTDCR